MIQNMSEKKVEIAEIFSSLQGEGPRLGEKHLFVRFPACNLHCHYCDEMGHEPVEMDMETLLEKIRAADRQHGPHSFLSLTGGEPLLYTGVIRQMASTLRPEGFKFYLETSGFLVKALDEVLDCVDSISMDVKLPSVTHDRDCLEEHSAFLKASQGKELHVKIVVSTGISREEFFKAVQMIHEINPATPLVLQPITVGGEKYIDNRLFDILTELQSAALGWLENVRIIPRLHKVLGVK